MNIIRDNKKIFKILITISLLIVVINKKSVLNADDVWVYNWGQFVNNGMKPYSDFNTVVSPLFIYFMAFITHYFNTLYIALIITIVLYITNCYLLAVIVKNTDGLKEIAKETAYLICTIIAALSADCEYNSFLYLLTLMLIVIFQKSTRNGDTNIIYLFLSSFICVCGIGLKTSLGILVTICIIANYILYYIKSKNIKNAIKNGSILLFFICVFLALLYFTLWKLNIINDFIDNYAQNSTSQISYNLNAMVLLAVFIPLIYISFRQYNSLLFLLSSLSLVYMVNAYPTLNAYHLSFVCQLIVLCLSLYLYNKISIYYILPAIALCVVLYVWVPNEKYGNDVVDMSDYVEFERTNETIKYKNGKLINGLKKYIEDNNLQNYCVVTGEGQTLYTAFNNYGYHKNLTNVCMGNVNLEKAKANIEQKRYIIIPESVINDSEATIYDNLIERKVFEDIAITHKYCDAIIINNYKYNVYIKNNNLIF